MKGKEVISDFRTRVSMVDPDALKKIQYLAADAQMKMFDIHARAIGCFCECLGMNAENCMAACNNTAPPNNIGVYHSVMIKWNLVNEKGEPKI